MPPTQYIRIVKESANTVLKRFFEDMRKRNSANEYRSVFKNFPIEGAPDVTVEDFAHKEGTQIIVISSL